MIDKDARSRLREEGRTKKIFESLSNSKELLEKNITDSIEKAVTGLLEKESKEFRITKGEDFYIDLLKYIVKRMDIQILLQLQMYRELKKMNMNMKGGRKIG